VFNVEVGETRKDLDNPARNVDDLIRRKKANHVNLIHIVSKMWIQEKIEEPGQGEWRRNMLLDFDGTEEPHTTRMEPGLAYEGGHTDFLEKSSRNECNDILLYF
jgi:hypothetical protein